MTINIGGNEISSLTIDGTEVQEVTVDGDVVYTAQEIIDDFSDGDLSEYTINTAGGSAGTASGIGGFSNESDPAGNITSDFFGESRPDWPNIVSQSGLNAYPSRGDTMQMLCRADFVGRMSMLYLWSGSSLFADSSTGYEFTVALPTDEFILRKHNSDGTVDTTTVSTGVIEEDIDTIIIAESDGSSVTGKVYQPDTIDSNSLQAEITINDSTYSGTGIGMAYGGNNSGGTNMYFDDVLKL